MKLSPLAPLCLSFLFAHGAAQAGGIERVAPTTQLLFSEGTVAEVTIGAGQPRVSGVQAVPAGPSSPAGTSSGDVAEDFTFLSFGFKADLREGTSIALERSNRLGADVFYAPDSGYLYGGSSLAYGGSAARLESQETRIMLRQDLARGFSLMAGLRVVETEGKARLFEGYTLKTSRETDAAPVLGLAWSRPDLGMRVALSYEAGVTHRFEAAETLPAGGFGLTGSRFRTEMPQSVTLEAQSGIAADTLIFGSLRWTEWSAFEISPLLHAGAYGPLASYHSDSLTWKIGLGRRFNDAWSGAVIASYEAPAGGFAGNLGPTDGYAGITLALSRKAGPFTVTGSLDYARIGNARVEAPTALGFPAGTTLANFRDNDAVGLGLKISRSF